MGNWLCSCTNAKDSPCSLSQKNSVPARLRLQGKTRNFLLLQLNQSGVAEAKCDRSSQGIPSTADLTVSCWGTLFRSVYTNPAATPLREVGGSNTKVIVEQPSFTDERSSEETFPGRRLKRPITGSDSNASLRSKAGEESQRSKGGEEATGHNEKGGSVSPLRQESHESEGPERSSQFKLLELLKIRLDIAANNMEINRLMANVERALDRTAHKFLARFCIRSHINVTHMDW